MIPFQIVFPDDGKNRVIKSFYVEIENDGVPDQRIATAQGISAFNIESRYNTRYFGNVSSTANRILYDLIISPLQYDDDGIGLKAVLLYEEDGDSQPIVDSVLTTLHVNGKS